MNEIELLQELIALADEAGLTVRPIRGGSGGEGEPTATSAICRIRGETWIVLSGSDSADERIDVLAQALRLHAREWLDSRFLSPAVRDRIALDDPE